MSSTIPALNVNVESPPIPSYMVRRGRGTVLVILDGDDDATVVGRQRLECLDDAFEVCREELVVRVEIRDVLARRRFDSRVPRDVLSPVPLMRDIADAVVAVLADDPGVLSVEPSSTTTSKSSNVWSRTLSMARWIVSSPLYVGMTTLTVGSVRS